MHYEISAPQCKEHGTYVLKQHGEVRWYLESSKALKCRAIVWYLWAHFQLDAHDDVFGYLKWNLGSWIWCYRSTRKWPKELTPAATLSMPFSIEALASTQIMLPQLSTLQHSAQAHFCSHLLLLLQEPQEQKYFRTWPERVKILVAPLCSCFSVSLKAIKVPSQTCKICQKTLRQKLGEFRGFDQKPLDIWTFARGRQIGPIHSSAWVLPKRTEEFQSYKMGGGMLSDRWDFSRSIKWAATKSKDYIALEVFMHI
jgi:hypothetical protein